MAKYVLHWLDGKREIVEGKNIAAAMGKAGICGGALAALDYYEEVKEKRKKHEFTSDLEKKSDEYAREWGTPTDDSFACCKQGFKDGYNEAKSEIVNLLNKHKETYLQLAKEYAEHFNADKTNSIAKNNYYSLAIAYNELEKVLSEIENRAQVAMLFNIPPKLNEDTLAAQLKRFNVRGD